MTSKLEAYLELMRSYLREADEAFAKGSFPQASEKSWGASAEVVKAVAAKRDVELLSHRDLWEFVTKLDKQHPKLNLLEMFHVANSLHMNFYENWLTPEAVEKGAAIVKEFTKIVERLT